jgi:hypothetical protein
MLAATLYDLRRRLARRWASRSAIGHGYRSASRWNSAVQRNAYGYNLSSASHGGTACTLHRDRLVDSTNGSADCIRRGVDRSCISRRCGASNTVSDTRCHAGNDRSWRVFNRCAAVRTETHRQSKAQPHRASFSPKSWSFPSYEVNAQNHFLCGLSACPNYCKVTLWIDAFLLRGAWIRDSSTSRIVKRDHE